MEYVRRIVDQEIDRRSKAFNAINIVGPKGCGKSRTAQERCKTIIEEILFGRTDCKGEQ